MDSRIMKASTKLSLILALFFLLMPQTVLACTSFCLDSNGFLVFGTNLDNRIHEGLVYVNKRNVAKRGWEQSTTGEYATWISQYGSVTFNFAGYQFVWAGMNEEGLVVSTMSLSTTENPLPDERPPLESGVWLQYQLDTAATIEEVIESDKVVRIANTVDHYLICDRRRNCAVIEFIGGEMVVHRGDALPVRALTNNTYEESIRYWGRSSIWKFFERVWSPPERSLRRFDISASRAQSFEENDTNEAVPYAFETLRRVCGEKVYGTPTQWSIVFDTQNLTTYFCTKMNPEVRSISLGELDFSCQSPVKMLDIHAELSGDVTDELVNYSHEVTLNHFLRFFRKWGLDIPLQRTQDLVRFLEGFECME